MGDYPLSHNVQSFGMAVFLFCYDFLFDSGKV